MSRLNTLPISILSDHFIYTHTHFQISLFHHKAIFAYNIQISYSSFLLVSTYLVPQILILYDLYQICLVKISCYNPIIQSNTICCNRNVKIGRSSWIISTVLLFYFSEVAKLVVCFSCAWIFALPGVIIIMYVE